MQYLLRSSKVISKRKAESQRLGDIRQFQGGYISRVDWSRIRDKKTDKSNEKGGGAT